MQLSRGPLVITALACVSAAVALPRAHAGQVEAATRLTLFREPSTSNAGVTVIHPQADVVATASNSLQLSAGYELDMVSGATPRTYGVKVDAVSGATHFADQRHAARAGFGYDTGVIAWTGSYSYGWENDYRSHTLSVGAHGDFFERNFTLGLAYTRNFDSVCDNNNARAQGLLDLQPLANSAHCFASGETDVVTRPVNIHTFEPSLAWTATPRLLLQAGVTLQVLDGFQSNPYRAVLVGSQGRAPQEHTPEHRQRTAVFGRLAYAIPTFRMSATLSGRLYRDTWDVTAGSSEALLQKYLGPAILISLRGRYHTQTGAIFYRTAFDYQTKGTVGSYWTGDRELSPLSSWLAGFKLAYLRRRGQQVDAWFDEVELNVKFEGLFYALPTGAPNADRSQALIWQGGLALRF